MNIKVYNASSFFQEEGLDANGIFRLLYNAVVRDYYANQPIVSGCGIHDELSNVLVLAGKDDFLRVTMSVAINAFKPDIPAAENRISQFHRDHRRHKEINAELSEISLWNYFFRRTPRMKKLISERVELETMQISLLELINVACCKFVKGKLGNEEDFVRAYREFFTEREENER